MPTSDRKRVLWVDDLPDSFAPLQFDKERAGVEVATATSVFTATEQLATHLYDAVLLDVRLDRDDFSGVDLLTDLRAGKYGDLNSRAPAALVTAYPRFDLAPDWEDGDFLGVFAKTDGVQPVLDMLAQTVLLPGVLSPDGAELIADSEAEKRIRVQFRNVQESVLREFGERPELLYRISSREFEELTAEMFERNGFEVVLTPASGDRGVDLYAARHTNLGSVLYVVDCKRYVPPHRVGPSLVRQLRGVVDREQATCGLLVTSSTFTPGAYDEEREARFRIALHDLNQVSRWLRGEPMIT